VRDKFHKEHDDAKKIKDNRAKIAMHGRSKHPPSLGVSNEPRIVHKARKRRALEVENEISKGLGGRGAATNNRLMKMFNNQKREETESRVAGPYLHVASHLMWFAPPIGRIWRRQLTRLLKISRGHPMKNSEQCCCRKRSH